jgi:hypothetical protein
MAPRSEPITLTPFISSNPIHRCTFTLSLENKGTFWQDPPGYFEQLVYPAYVEAHRSMFTVRLSP